jgi:mannose-1-phosphate guanylyltransferase/mannose-6-phosphate isomerase
MNVQPVILCGGSGTRLWPLSREEHPKQLLALNGERTLLQLTCGRLEGLEIGGTPVLAPLVVCSEAHRFMVAEQLRAIDAPARTILLEPAARGTAPALTLAAVHAVADDDPVLVAMPSDHVIGDPDAFRRSIAAGAALAAEGRVVTFGVPPARPETGYGYIRTGRPLARADAPGARRIEAFVEKPGADAAAALVASGEHLWNSGIFAVRASVWIECIGRFRREILAACERARREGARDGIFLRVAPQAFEDCPTDSIDYAVMEHLCERTDGEPPAEGAAVPLAAGWSDVGAWNALWDIEPKDAQGNVVHGDVHVLDTRNALLVAGHRLLACVGLEDVVVIETPDAVMVARKDRAQDVKRIVARLKQEGRRECLAHRKVVRPWGSYDAIDSGERFQVKRIVVSPGASLSLQMHHHRAEHWVVVRGTARVRRGDEEFLLTENQSTYIPLGVRHRLENPGRVPLEIIEVQSGAYLGEDDIVRFDDRYGRVRTPL